MGDAITKLIERLEAGFPPHEADDICRQVEAIDLCPNKNGSCRGYIYSIEAATTLIPAGLIWAITHDLTESRATVGHFPFDGVALGISRGPWRDSIALCIAALRARLSCEG